LPGEKVKEWSGTSVNTMHFYGNYQYACGTTYIGDWANGKRHGKGKLNVINGDVYEGDFVESKRHGYGVYSFSKPIKGVIYKGEWAEDLRHGNGAAEWPDGTYFQGRWEQGIQKFGTFVWPMRGEYTGEWNGAHMEGEGIFRTAGGDTYEGTWKNSVLNGEGIRKTPNGETYKGYWENGQLNGIAEIITNIGLYQGEVVKSIENGKGKMVWNDHSEYDGDWRDGLPHGMGNFKAANQEVYEGDFKEGKKEGRGRKIFLNYDIYDGEWLDDIICGQGTMIYGSYSPDEDNLKPKYVGEWKNNMRDGFGIMRFEDESVYEGDWIANKRHGKGKLKMIFMTPEGEKQHMTYEGQFQNDNISGYGVMIWSNGDVYKGEWENGKRQGRGQLKFKDKGWIYGIFNNDELVDASLNQIIAKNTKNVQAFHEQKEDDLWLHPEIIEDEDEMY